MNNQRGFTFFEILVTMGIFTMVGGFALFVSMETFRGTSFRSDRDLLVSALQHARAQAMNNACLGSATDCNYNGKRHGVAIRPSDHPDSYVIFQTSADYAGRTLSDKAQDAIFDTNQTLTSAGAAELVFSQLSGTTSCSSECAVTLRDQTGHVSSATTTADGRIYWSN